VAGLPQEQPAAGGCTQPQWADIERRRYADPRLSTYRILARPLGVEVTLKIIRGMLEE